MKMNRGRHFSLSRPQDKIELLVCQSGGYNCKDHLSEINEYYLEANNYHFDKDYLNTIELLKSAFFKTSDLKEASCIKCANFFRSTITQSLENVNNELQNLTTGLFRRKRYESSYKASCDVLNDLKKVQ